MMRLFGIALLALNLLGQQADLAVVQKIAGSVGFYTQEGKLVGEVKVGDHPHEAVLSNDKRLLYVTDNGILWMTDPGDGGNTISIVDVNERKKIGVIDLGAARRPHGIDIDPQTGRLVATIENPSGLLLIDPVARKVLRQFDVKGKAPHMVRFGTDAGVAYVSNTGTGTLAAVNLRTGDAKTVATGARPQGTAFSRDRKTLYVANSEANTISIVDAASLRVNGTIATGKWPCRLALSPDGKTLIYALQNAEAVGFADIATRKEVHQLPLGGKLLSLTLSSDGRYAYSSAQEQDKIFVVSLAERKIARVIDTPKGSGPDPVIPLR
ncbi:MAG: beta-propeller fold lactonase family protein [Acidobacteriota bacterium]|nr:beta-propeller fold lactonase family protein [Acidobacteriota bacterium]